MALFNGVSNGGDPVPSGFVPVSAMINGPFIDKNLRNTMPYYNVVDRSGAKHGLGEGEIAFRLRSRNVFTRGEAGINPVPMVATSLNGFDGSRDTLSLESAYQQLRSSLPTDVAQRVIADVTLSLVDIIGVTKFAHTYNDRYNGRVTTLQIGGVARVRNRQHIVHGGQIVRATVQTLNEFRETASNPAAKKRGIDQKFLLVVEGINPQSVMNSIMAHYVAYRTNIHVYTSLFRDGAWSASLGWGVLFEMVRRFGGMCGPLFAGLLERKGICNFNFLLNDDGTFSAAKRATAITNGSFEFLRRFTKRADTETFPDTETPDGTPMIKCDSVEPILMAMFGAIDVSPDNDNTHGRWLQEFVGENDGDEERIKKLSDTYTDMIMFNPYSPKCHKYEIGYDASRGISRYILPPSHGKSHMNQPDLACQGGIALRFQQQSLQYMILAFSQALMMYNSTILGTATGSSNPGEDVNIMLRI